MFLHTMFPSQLPVAAGLGRGLGLLHRGDHLLHRQLGHLRHPGDRVAERGDRFLSGSLPLP